MKNKAFDILKATGLREAIPYESFEPTGTERERYNNMLKEIFDKEPKFHSWGTGLHNEVFDIAIESSGSTGKGSKSYLIGTAKVSFYVNPDGWITVETIDMDVDVDDVQSTIEEINRIK